ncbi:hypothetical protein ACU686_04100 [Yinghuangia aomiensis]
MLSTISVATLTTCAERADALGVHVVDCGVTGGPQPPPTAAWSRCSAAKPTPSTRSCRSSRRSPGPSCGWAAAGPACAPSSSATRCSTGSGPSPRKPSASPWPQESTSRP